MNTQRLMALALTLCAGGAQAADSGVTLYGVVDAAVGTTRVSGPGGLKSSSAGMISSGYGDSVFGLRGSEDLGNGWSAVFMLETSFDVGTGGRSNPDALFGNSSWVGVSNPAAGELRLGRQYTVAQETAIQLELAPWKDMGMGSTFKASDSYQVPNAVSYRSPDFGGFSVAAGYSFDVAGNQISGQSAPAVSSAIRYAQGPLLLLATWDRTYLSGRDRPGPSDPQAWQLGGSYDFEAVKVSAAWSRQSNGYVGLNGGDPDQLGLGLGAAEFADGGHLDAYLIGAAVPVTPSDTVLAQWSLVRPSWAWRDGRKARPGQVASVGLVHELSKRTKLYAMAGIATRYALDEQLVQGQGTTTRLMSGINHAF